MKNLAQIFFFLLLASSLYGQAGFNVYAGLSNATNRDATITPEGTSLPGFLVGGDARLNADKMYFVIGGQYHQINFLAQEDKNFFSVDEKMVWLKLRVGLGFDLINFSDNLVLRAKALGSINVISSHPDIPSAPFSEFSYNSGTAGAVVGFGIDVLCFTFDVEYERGFFNAINMVPGTEYDFVTATVGVFF